MDAGDLRVFEAVARLGGMNRAAAELNTVQSNVTARVKLLEEELEQKLFERHSRGVTPTAAGRRLLPYAQRVAQLLDEARRAAMDDGKPKGALVIGSLETTAALRLSPLLTQFAEAYPAVDLMLRTGTTAELVEAVLQRHVEGAFVCGPVDHPDLQETTIFREELVVLTSPAIRTLDEVLARRDLKIVVLRLGCSYRQRLEEVLTRRGVVGLRRMEFGTLESIIACVSAGLGITMLPRSLIGPVWRDGRMAIHALPGPESKAETQFIRRRDALASSALTAFLDLTRRSRWQVEAAD
ncbi:MAG: LysR family transcriptional regulator [Alphaproteobacteria bacterium]|nr:LysR family transcriptional regulator [Alphaproteobacteria bacterium]